MFLYNGSPERYNWKLVGKKEMYINYNNNKLLTRALDVGYREKMMTPRHLNPTDDRWELHRVWVVEATLKEDARHVYAKRTFYLDEDSWQAMACDIYDGRDQSFAHILNAYDVPAAMIRSISTHDFQNDAYYVGELDSVPLRVYSGEPASFYTAGNIRKMSRR